METKAHKIVWEAKIDSIQNVKNVRYKDCFFF